MASTWAFEAQGPGSIPGGGAISRIPSITTGELLNRLDLAIVLAAGDGTRMKSTTAKVLHEISGRSLVGHVLHAVSETQVSDIRVVVGAQHSLVTEHLNEIAPKVKTVLQEKRNGTGHAVRLALQAGPVQGTVLVTAGDTPLLTGTTLNELIAEHESAKAVATVLTAEVPDPFGYGRIVRDERDELSSIVEEKDATPEIKNISEINSGVYLFEAAALIDALGKITTNNAQGEEYLTDVIAIMKKDGKKVIPIVVNNYTEILGINDRAQLSECGQLMRDRINHAVMLSGVTIIDPATTWIDVSVEIAPNVTIYPGTTLSGLTVVESGAVIGPRSTLINATVKSGARIIESVVSGTSIGENSSVGPFTYLRDGNQIANETRVGAFVEMKNSILGQGSKVPHLSYVGDATIGEGTNIGAATVFVNYDGVEKHKTEIGDHVRIGSDTMLVAPVSVGDGAYTAAGSVITEDVPAGAMGVGRARQRNIVGWVLRKRPGTKSAEIAASENVEKKKK